MGSLRVEVIDNARRYGLVTRLLHWTMAALFAWQFTGMILKYVLGRVPLMAFWVGTHASVGALLALLILIRIAWALAQRGHRPAYDAGLLGRLAAGGHLLMYVLMLVVPTLGLLRLIGGERPVALFGMALRPGLAQEIGWMTAPANMIHAPLAWTLLALILGHVAMVLVHRFVWRDDTLARMAGGTAGPATASVSRSSAPTLH